MFGPILEFSDSKTLGWVFEVAFLVSFETTPALLALRPHLRTGDLLWSTVDGPYTEGVAMRVQDTPCMVCILEL